MNFMEYSKKYMSKINDAIASIYERKTNSVKNKFLRDYYIELKNYFLAGGKRIRPLVCVATYNAFSKNNDDNTLSFKIFLYFSTNVDGTIIFA